MKASTKFDSVQKKTIFMLAGEESGDLHGSFLVKELFKLNSNLSFIGHGGDKMKAAGVEIIEHISSLALVGLTEIIRQLPSIRRTMIDTVSLITTIKPTRIILIDYPGFNLRLAKKIYKLKIPVTYFILPQVWAWKENRIKKLKIFTDQAISIIPFEKDWYQNKGMDIDYVGHPLTDIKMPLLSKRNFFDKHSLKIEQPLLTLLPGSRQQEIERHWPIFVKTIEDLHKTFPELQFIIGKAPDVEIENIPSYVKIEEDNNYLTMRFGTAGIVASGTAALEATVFKLPIIVCYKTSAITHLIGKRISKVKYLSLTNLISNKKIIPELIQKKMTPERLIKAIVPLLSDTPERTKILDNYETVITQLGESGVYYRAAKLISAKI